MKYVNIGKIEDKLQELSDMVKKTVSLYGLDTDRVMEPFDDARGILREIEDYENEFVLERRNEMQKYLREEMGFEFAGTEYMEKYWTQSGLRWDIEKRIRENTIKESNPSIWIWRNEKIYNFGTTDRPISRSVDVETADKFNLYEFTRLYRGDTRDKLSNEKLPLEISFSKYEVEDGMSHYYVTKYVRLTIPDKYGEGKIMIRESTGKYPFSDPMVKKEDIIKFLKQIGIETRGKIDSVIGEEGTDHIALYKIVT